jgi:asparagine synthetase B (glutamine-hydrolysing)
MMPAGGTAIEGTGADGAYGLGAGYAAWRSIYLVPRFLRRAVGAAYRASQLWRSDSRAAHALRFVRKSARMPLSQAVIAQHALDGIALHSTPDMRRDVAETVRTSIEALTVGLEPPERLSLVDLVLVCAGRMAPKSFDPLRRYGLMPRYPYLEPPMLAVSGSLPWADKCAGRERKAPLKALLARDVPSDWVYRAKHGFTPPEREILSSPAAQERLHTTVLAPGGPLAGLCRADAVRHLATLVRQVPVGSGVHDLLWVLLFTATWLEQVPHGRPARSATALPADAPEAMAR